MSKIAISQSNYIPWKGYFDLIRSVDVFVIYDEVQYTKNDWRNRNKIKTQNGPIWLTIPVKQNNLQQSINETMVQNNIWVKKHLNSIRLNYSKAPYFKDFFPFIEELYLSIESDKLSEINEHFLREILTFYNINTRIERSENLDLKGNRIEKLIDAVEKLKGNTYVSGPNGSNYLDESFFQKANINLQYFSYDNFTEYPQIHGEFSHHLSIIDCILNCGNQFSELIKKN